jgi:hypothetical protein
MTEDNFESVKPKSVFGSFHLRCYKNNPQVAINFLHRCCILSPNPPSLALVMFLLASVAPFIVLASTVVANPIVVRDSRPSYSSLSLKKRVKPPVTDRHLVRRQKDCARCHTVRLTSEITYYQAIVGVGTPPTNCGSSQPRSFPVSYTPFTDTLTVDTGSANTWVGGDKGYVTTNSSHVTTDSVVSIVFCLARACIAQTNDYALEYDLWHRVYEW